MVTLKQTQVYHKKKKGIPGIISSRTDAHETIYGARSLNAHFPKYLRSQTTDYDIFSPTPKKDAKETERALDKYMGFNAFRTEPAQHKGTWKVKSNVTGEGYADYTKPETKICREKVGDKYYACVSWMERQSRKTLRDPEAKYRYEKEHDVLNRIKLWRQKK